MNPTYINMRLAAALLVFCLCNIVLTEQMTHNRHKRGFRQDAASRVAHGYGKRGDIFNSRERLSQSQIENLSNALEGVIHGSTTPVEEIEELLASHPNLARLLLQKYAESVGDDFVSSEQLSKRVIKK
uniref:Allatotropin n=2 Tax=Arion vulgaris TaxID=1028688 RepID=A0A0B6ZE24_9EUPU